MQSVRAFSGANDANEMLKGLRYFERAVQGKSGMEAKGYIYSKLNLDVYHLYNNYSKKTIFKSD